LLTGCRADEIGSLSWAEVCYRRRAPRIPGIVPLSTPARDILEARPKMLGRDFVFGRPHSAV
jgi:integrase